jgi:hypothetical protein
LTNQELKDAMDVVDRGDTFIRKIIIYWNAIDLMFISLEW